MLRHPAHDARNRQLQIGKQTVNCQLLYKQLGAEIETLDRRINQLQQHCQPDLTQLNHLGKVLQNRQTILSWLSIRDLVNQ